MSAVILLSATALAVSLFARLGLGSLIGFLAAGVLVSGSGLATPEQASQVREVTELGVVLLLFVIGLEIEPKKLWSMRRLVFGLGTAQMLASGAAIALYVSLFVDNLAVAIILGLGLALSSTAFVLQLLSERGDLASDHGKASFGVLLLQDLAIVPLLALVPILSRGLANVSEETLGQKLLMVAGVVAIVVFAGRYLFPFLLARSARSRNRQAFAMFAVLAALGSAWVIHLADLSMALGALMMGMLLSASEYRHQIEASVDPFKGVLIGLFFISVGMSIDLSFFAVGGFALLVHVAIILILKTVTLLLVGLAFGLKRATAIRTAFLLSQCGEFGFVLFAAAAASGILNELQFMIAILSVSVSMIATPLMVKLGDMIVSRYGGEEDVPSIAPASGQTAVSVDRHVVIAGHGRVGQIMGLLLEKAAIPYVAFDFDPRQVEEARSDGKPVHYGDMSDPRVLAAAGVGRALAVVVTVNELQPTQRLVAALRLFYPGVPIYARVRDLAAADSLQTHTVAKTVPVAIEGGLVLGQTVLQGVGLSEDDTLELITACRRDNYDLLRRKVSTT